MEFVYGLITTISGGGESAAALATGIGIAAEPVTIAVTAEGVVTVVDGVNTIHYGITAFKKDADKGKEAKEADSKAADNGRNTSAGEYAAPSGGGGITSTIKENGKTVNFGHGGTIQSILTNEKYKGDAVLNKTYISDCLTKKVKINNGERPKYYVENNHPAIIDSADKQFG